MATFKLDPSVDYLNHGSFGATPQELLDVQRSYQDELEHEPVDFLVRRLPGLLAGSREALGPFLGADPADLAFIPNATTGINAVLRSLRLNPGDELLTTTHRYGAVRAALDQVADRSGARVVEAPVPCPIASPAAVLDAVTNGFTDNTRLLLIDWITSPTGLVLPVHDMVQAARARGVPTLVDGAHAPGQVHVDLRSLGADWWVGNLHKWLCAPKGAAALWTAPRHQAHTHAAITSHGYGLGYREAFDWPGTFDPSPWLVTPAAIALHQEMGGPDLRRAHREMALRARRALAQAAGLGLPCPDELVGAMAAVPLPLDATHAETVWQHLFQAHRVEVPVQPWAGRCWLRVSCFSAYNHDAQYIRLASLLGPILAAIHDTGAPPPG